MVRRYLIDLKDWCARIKMFYFNFIKFEINFYLTVIYSFFKKLKKNPINFLKTELKLRLIIFNNWRKFFLKKYIYTINHKRIALNYFYFSMMTGLTGAALATIIRLELSFPGSPFLKGDSLKYLQIITTHGLVMIFFVVVPLLFGGFANFLIPYHVGSKDVAFPRLNSIGFWIQPCGFLLLARVAGFRPQFWRVYDKPSFFKLLPPIDAFEDLAYAKYFYKNRKLNFRLIKDEKIFQSFEKRKVIDNLEDTKHTLIPFKLQKLLSTMQYSENFWYTATRAIKQRRKKLIVSKCSNRTLTLSGWAFITPFSSNIRYTGRGVQDVAVISVIFSGVSTTISIVNLLVTRRVLGLPGLRTRRNLMPFITIGLLVSMRMLAAVTPVLGAAMFMILADRHWYTSFFDVCYGGDTVLFQHLFWFFGHPEVYILIIPTFGIINMVISRYNMRRVASKNHLVWAIYMMGAMGFLVWGHHMYLVGLDHRSRALYSTVTVMISLPATIKIVNWTLTFLNGALKWDLLILYCMFYVMFFLAGGLTGMWLSHLVLNITLHDTFYVIAHFHLMLSGATITACFIGLYYYFWPLFGVKYSKILSFAHMIYYFFGQWLTFIPLFWAGCFGMPRRIHDYPDMYTKWHNMATVGHFVTLLGILLFFLVLFDAHLKKEVIKGPSLGIPRWFKRVNYYIYKSRKLLIYKQEIKTPNSLIRLLLKQPYCNEYEMIYTEIAES